MGVDGYIPDYFDGETTSDQLDQVQAGKGPETVPLWVSNLFGETDEEQFEGFHPDCVTDSSLCRPVNISFVNKIKKSLI